MRRLYLWVLILWICLGDLATAWLYGGGRFPAVTLLRPGRDALVVGGAALCLLTLRMPAALLRPMLIYCLMALAYLPAGWFGGLPPGIVVGSLGTLLIPVLFLLAGYYALRGPADLRGAAMLLVVFGLASTAFGAWDIGHTGFWIDTVQFPAYQTQVKGLVLGANPASGLPWNFYRDDEGLVRRAAGLLAAPLAQGMVLAVAAVLSLAVPPRRLRWFGLVICGVLFAGIWMSGTRGAMLAGGVALVGYLATARGMLRAAPARWLAAAAAILVIGVAARGIVDVTASLGDSSAIGHWTALRKNIADIHQVLLFGAGLGRQGAVAADAGLPVLGGGEGAIFSIAFQIGVPAALAFLWLYGACLRLLWRSYRATGDAAVLALFWLACGIATTLITSDHVLSVSGTAPFWLLAGGAVRVGAAARVRAPAGAMAPAASAP